MAVRKNRFVVLISLVAALGGLLFGFDTAIISGAIPTITEYFRLDEFSLGWAVSAVLIGCALGALLAGKASDTFGRRSVLVICALLFAISGIGAALSQSLWVFVLFRLVGGLGVGAAAMVSPMYIAEVAPAEERGKLVSLYQLAIVSGILLAYFTDYIFNTSGANGWRWMFASQGVPSMIFLVLLVFVPESPRWLIKKRETRKALLVLQKTFINPFEELGSIEKSFIGSKTVYLRKIFDSPYRRLLWTGILIAVIQQVTGINAILYYAPQIFKEAGLDSSGSLLQTMGIGAVNLLATFVAICLVDRLGRKNMLLAGSLVMCASLVAIAICFSHNFFAHFVLLIFLLVYVGAFGCTLGAVTWVYLSEIFPNKVRAQALSIATLSLWIADFLVSYSFPVMVKKMGTSGTLFCYAALCSVAFFYMFFRLKETRGKSLEEMEMLFI